MADCIHEEEHDDEHSNSETTRDEEESRSLEYLLGGRDAVSTFFDQVYQVSCAVYSIQHGQKRPIEQKLLPQEQRTFSTPEVWNLARALDNPLRYLVEQGWEVLCDLMDQPQPQQQKATFFDADQTPLLFRDCTRVSLEEQITKYSFLDCSNAPISTGTTNTDTDDTSTETTTTRKLVSLWAAFLDGCSVVINHCDRVSPWIAALCQDLQRSLPHTYANAYVTPAHSQTVPAHADDRDVLVVQVYGRKHWKVYQNIPIPYPYPHEQVGKDDPSLPVPDSVVQGPLLLDRILEPGDCLYLPRGYVHEARACPEDCSFHVTVAMATHDWTLAGWLSRTAEQVWTQQIPLRRAVDRKWGRSATVRSTMDKEEMAQQQQAALDAALQLLLEEITATNLEQSLRNKYERHNRRAAQVRLPLMESYSTIKRPTTTVTVGRAAASTVTLQSWLRAATVEEKEHVLLWQKQQQQRQAQQSSSLPNSPKIAPSPVGLHVRTETYNGILILLKELQQPAPRPLHAVATLVLQQQQHNPIIQKDNQHHLICPLTVLSMARRCVELGALAVVRDPEQSAT